MFLMHFKQSFQRLLTLIEIVAEGEINLTIFKPYERYQYDIENLLKIKAAKMY